MKTLYLLTFLFFVTTKLFGQWTIENTGNTNLLASINFVNDSIGYSAGWDGTIIKTIDGGTNWTVLNSTTSADLYCIYFLNADTGFAGGGVVEPIFLKTTDGGVTWVQIPNTGFSNTVEAIFFINTNIGLAVDGTGHFLKTTDAGNTWNIYTTNFDMVSQGGGIATIFFTSDSIGFAVGGYGPGAVYVTSNSGEANCDSSGNITKCGLVWTISTTTENPLEDVNFVDANIGYAVGQYGTIIKTTNAGLSWTTLNAGTVDDFSYVFFIDSNYGYVSSGDGLFKTADGGNSWSLVTSTPDPQQIYFVNKCLGFVALGNGDVAKTPVIPIIQQNATTICQGDSATLTLRNSTFTEFYPEASYLWNTGATTSYINVSTAGNFYVTVIDSNGCSETSAITNVVVNSLPPMPFITKMSNQLESSSSYGNQWYLNNSQIDTAYSQFYTPTVSGSYTVAITDSNGCASTSAPLNVTITGVDVINELGSISVYPNPTTGNLYFDGVKEGYTIEVYDVVGKIIYTCKTSNGNYLVNLTGTAKGIYFYRINEDSGVIQQGKVIVE